MICDKCGATMRMANSIQHKRVRYRRYACERCGNRCTSYEVLAKDWAAMTDKVREYEALSKKYNKLSTICCGITEKWKIFITLMDKLHADCYDR